MKKIFTFFALALAIGTSTNSLAQANSQGNFIFDAYYGFPNLGASIYKNFENDQGTSSFKASGVGPMGLRAEYMVADRFGLGIDVIYNSNTATYIQTDTTQIGSSGQYYTTTNSYERTMQRLRVQARFNIHFNVDNPSFDWYFGLGAGTNNRVRTVYRNGAEIEDDWDLGNLVAFPVSMRVCLGARYYFTENIGLNAEIGLGGPVLSAGASFRF